MEILMVTAVCLKWGNKYGPEYVNKLYGSVKRNLTIPFRFVCVTEDSTGFNPEIETLPLRTEGMPVNMRHFQGWWFKLDLFRSDNGLTGKIFYIDLDTIITGNIDHCVTSASGFVTLRDFYRGYPARGDQLPEVGSGLLSWQAGQHQNLYDDFMLNMDDNMKKYPGGDQMWIQAQVNERSYWQDLALNQIVSYKVHCIKDRRRAREESWLPEDTRIVCFHGTPNPHDVRHHDWVREHWAE
jgi:hypothetical protein